MARQTRIFDAFREQAQQVLHLKLILEEIDSQMNHEACSFGLLFT